MAFGIIEPSTIPYVIVSDVADNAREENLSIKPYDDVLDSDYILNSSVADQALEKHLSVRTFGSLKSDGGYFLGSLVADQAMESDVRVAEITAEGGYF